MRFREDILRGVRLFAIIFAVILVCVAAYRMMRVPSDIPGAPPEAATQPDQPSEPSPDAPAAQSASDAHPLVVPEPPPVNGKPVATPVARPVQASRPKDLGVPPPPPVAASPVRAHRATTLSGREFESSAPVALPAPTVEDPGEAKPLPAKPPVGYKSLIEANPNSPAVQPSVAPIPADEAEDKTPKGNRFTRAVGRIFHSGGKKEAEPSTLQPKQP